jgi:flagellar motor switch/type III secretory pathway protein FliN
MSAPSQNLLPVASAIPPVAASNGTAGDENPADLLPWLPCTVSLEIPLAHFTIGDLSKLGRGSIVTTTCRHLSDIPLYVNGQLIGWTEFEVIDDRLAVRITEIA